MTPSVTHAGGVPVEFKYGARALDQDAAQAMGNDYVLGAIEALTNADDATPPASATIVIGFRRAKHWQMYVRDYGSGMSRVDMEERLMQIGERPNSRGRTVKRGNRGRGGRDLVVFGEVVWDSIRDNAYAWLWLRRDKNELTPHSETITAKLRSALGIPHGNGTLVTITFSQLGFPQLDTVLNELQNAVPLRILMRDPQRDVQLEYRSSTQVIRRRLVYTRPPGLVKIDEQILAIPGYNAQPAHLTLYESPDPIPEPSEELYRQDGILITSGRAAHEATFFGRDNPYLRTLVGELDWPVIDQLIDDYDYLRTQRLDDPANPMPFIRRDRAGLDHRHPAYKALQNVVRVIIDDYAKRKQAEQAQQALEAPEVRRALDRVAAALGNYYRQHQEELEESPPPGDEEAEEELEGLRVIPPVRKMAPQTEATLTLRYRPVAGRQYDRPPVATITHVGIEADNIVAVSAKRVAMPEVLDQPGLFRGQLHIASGTQVGSALIDASVDGVRAPTAEIHVVIAPTPPPLPLPRTLSFERQFYQVRVGKTKRLLLRAPAALVKKVGADVQIMLDAAGGIELLDPTVRLRARDAAAYYDADVRVRVSAVNAAGTVRAVCGPQIALALVRAEQPRGANVRILPEEQPDSILRSRVDNADPSVLRIFYNVAHPANSPFLGDPPEYDGQRTALGRLAIAESITQAVVRDLVQRTQRAELDASKFYYWHVRHENKVRPLVQDLLATTTPAQLEHGVALPSRRAARSSA